MPVSIFEYSDQEWADFPINVQKLVDIHTGCIENDNAVLTFLSPFPREEMFLYWQQKVAECKTAGRALFLAADDETSAIVGCVMLGKVKSLFFLLFPYLPHFIYCSDYRLTHKSALCVYWVGFSLLEITEEPTRLSSSLTCTQKSPDLIEVVSKS